MSNKEEVKTEIIKTTEDKVRLALKERKEIESSSSRFFTLIGFLISFLVPLFTSTFKDVGPLKANILTSIFIVLSCICFIMIVVECVKIIKNRIKSQGDDDWFIFRIQDKKKPKKEKPTKNIGLGWDWGSFFNILIKIFLWVLPLALWILVMSLIGWKIAWSTNGETPNWVWALIASIIWFVSTYFTMFMYSEAINDFIDDRVF